VELKARDPAPERSRQICRNLGAEDLGTIWQRDTYFAAPSGRLKLREQKPGEAQLIHYERLDEPLERESRYRIAPVAAAVAIQSVLEACLGVRTTVTKRRHLFIWERVRIHLDDVEQLGSFIEFEAVAPQGSDLADEHQLVARLREAFELTDELLVPSGYADQLLSRGA
jgi:adenylate cyclase class IV